MTPRASVSVALLTVLVLSGCLGSGGPPAPSSSTSTTTTTSSTTSTSQAPLPGPPVLDLLLGFEFVGCHGMSLRHTRPLADVQALLPTGFVAASPPDGAGTTAGILGIDLYACSNMTTPNIVLPATVIGWVWTFIETPTERVPGAPEAASQEYVFRVLAGEDIVATLFRAAEYDVYNGSASVESLSGAEPARVGISTVGADYFFLLVGADSSAVSPPRDQAFARYAALADDSVLVWTGTYALPTAATGVASMEVADDDPFAAYAPPERRVLAANGVLVDAGDLKAQDLRRVFTPAP